MHVNRVTCGDFVVYTEKEHHVNEMMPYDKQFTQAGIQKIELFFRSHILPEILSGRLESKEGRGRESDEDNEQELFCL